MKRVAIILMFVALGVMVSAAVAVAVVKNGNDGPNRLVGTAENDYLNGHRGNDVVIGRADSDRLFGGRGNDRIDARDPRPEGDLVGCGRGNDRAVIDPSTEDRVRGCERVMVRR